MSGVEYMPEEDEQKYLQQRLEDTAKLFKEAAKRFYPTVTQDEFDEFMAEHASGSEAGYSSDSEAGYSSGPDFDYVEAEKQINSLSTDTNPPNDGPDELRDIQNIVDSSDDISENEYVLVELADSKGYKPPNFLERWFGIQKGGRNKHSGGYKLIKDRTNKELLFLLFHLINKKNFMERTLDPLKQYYDKMAKTDLSEKEKNLIKTKIKAWKIGYRGILKGFRVNNLLEYIRELRKTISNIEKLKNWMRRKNNPIPEEKINKVEEIVKRTTEEAEEAEKAEEAEEEEEAEEAEKAGEAKATPSQLGGKTKKGKKTKKSKKTNKRLKYRKTQRKNNKKKKTKRKHKKRKTFKKKTNKRK